MRAESQSSSRPLAPAVWIGLPALAAVLATVLLGVPFRLFGLALPEPVFPLALAFAWPVIRPSLLAPAVLLVLGLVLELYWAAPKGLWSMALLIGYGAALLCRRYLIGQSAATLAAWYVGVVLLAFSAAYLFVTLDSGIAPSATATGLQVAVTAALFPLAYALIRRFEDADVRFR